MRRLTLALLIASSLVAQQSTGVSSPAPPPATPQQIAELTAKLDQMKSLIQAGQLTDAYRLNMSFSAELGKLSVRVLTPEERLLECEERMAERPQSRSWMLAMAGRFALEAGQLDKAEAFAQELLTLSESDAKAALPDLKVHAAHILLGRVALQRTHDLVRAKAELMAAARVASSGIQKFGPNMSLARDLLAAGERETVLAYVNSFHDLSPEVMEKMSKWAKLIQSGAFPDFGANTLFHM